MAKHLIANNIACTYKFKFIVIDLLMAVYEEISLILRYLDVYVQLEGSQV